MVMTSDQFLRFREGNSVVFRQVFDDYSPRITSFARNFLKDDPYIEDIVNDIFRTAWEKREKFAGPQHLKNFLYIVTRNQCINYLKFRQLKKTSDKQLIYILSDTRDNELPLDLERAQTEVFSILHEVLNGLPSPSREVIKMSFFERKSTKEIAEGLQLSETNVYTIKSRTLDKLQSLLPKDLFDFLLLFIGGL
jgi:RNA polymerase sigma-70 factor (family 1)